MDDILKTLEDEHELLLSLFKRINETSDDDAELRSELLASIEENLVPHAKWEDTVFYPAFASRADHEGLLTHAQAVQEHRAVEITVLPDLLGAEAGTRQFAGSAKALGEMIAHHAEEEETAMFSLARQLFSAEERADMDREYAKWKASASAGMASAAAHLKGKVKGALRPRGD